jgi:hypothetical protein
MAARRSQRVAGGLSAELPAQARRTRVLPRRGKPRRYCEALRCVSRFLAADRKPQLRDKTGRPGYCRKRRGLHRGIATCIYKLRRAAELLNPEGNYGWLLEIERDLALVIEPRSKFDRLVLAHHLVNAGLTLVTEAQAFAKSAAVQ